MRIKDIQIEGFGVWTGLSVDSLPDGMTLFYGPNEAGKTTLMQFVRAVFYGFTPERRKRYLPPLHGGSPGGMMRVTGPGGGYHLRRRAELNDNSVTGQLTVSGSDGLVQGQHRLNSLLGQVDEAIFTNVFAIGLRELQELSTLDDTSAADELYKLSSGLDRVSLVDVMRSLRSARDGLVGVDPDDPHDGRVAELLQKRAKLRDEIDLLTRQGQRWGELAAIRRAQTEEIGTLRERLAETKTEARCAELAIEVRDTWSRRERLQQESDELSAGLDLPEEAPATLVRLRSLIEQRSEKLEEVKRQRRAIRDEADALPVSRRLLELQPRIEAAAEQAPWLHDLQSEIERLDQQIEKVRQQLDDEAQEMGLDDDDRLSLLDGGRSGLPDMSRQTLTALSGPARAVREQLFRMKQARDEGHKDRDEARRLRKDLDEKLGTLAAEDLNDAIRKQGQVIATFRRRIQVEDGLGKLRRHLKDIESEAVDLTTAQAMPLDRVVLLAAPFIAGGILTIYGMLHILNIMVDRPDPVWGAMVALCGIALLVLYYAGRQLADKNTVGDLSDCERQLDALRRQIRDVEHERAELEQELPPGTGTLEARLRDAESHLADLEGMLPTYHGYQAAKQRYETARRRASEAAAGLKKAKSSWRRTLHELGLSESLSPKSVRDLSSGYESLHTTLQRIGALREECDQRRRELSSLGQRIDALYRQAIAGEQDPSEATGQTPQDAAARPSAKPSAAPPSGTASAGRADRRDPLRQLDQMTDELARHQHWIEKRRELREQDVQLKKQHQQHQRAIEKANSAALSLLARCGVENQEEFDQLVDRRVRLADVSRRLAEADQQIRTVIGTQANYDDVARHLDAGKADSLERRWEALNEKIEQTQSRIDALQTRQGEVTQEMKQLAGDPRLSEAQLELSVVQNQLEACVRDFQDLATTSRLLEEVCQTFEKERQPEVLREASSFLGQLTGGRYRRIWTPLGTNALKVENSERESLPLDVLSRGTREAVFIALRLALAGAYARRGVMLPLVMDDVLVNFDRQRALSAARTLQQFAALGHQVMMFTCHQHIVDIFHEIGTEVRLMPPQGQPGEAVAMLPEPTEAEEEWEETAEDEEAVAEVEEETTEDEEEEVVAEAEEEEVAEAEEELEEEEAEEEPVADAEDAASDDEEVEESEAIAEAEPEPVVIQITPPAPKPRQQRSSPPLSEIDWLWYERDPAAAGSEGGDASPSPEPADLWWHTESV